MRETQLRYQREGKYTRLITIEVLVIFVLLTTSACGGGAGRLDDELIRAEDAKAEAERNLEKHRRLYPKSLPCFLNYGATNQGVVYGLSPLAEQSGLRAGDKIVAIGGVPVNNSEERGHALSQQSPGASVPVEIQRGAERITLTLRCKDHAPIWAAQRKLLESQAHGDWQACVEATRELERAMEFRTALLLDKRIKCAERLDLSLGRQPGPSWALMEYDLGRQLIRDAQYIPEVLEQSRGWLLSTIDRLRKLNQIGLADDLENYLQQASEHPQSSATLQPPTVQTQATGFAVRNDGTLLTAFHVVQGAKTIRASCGGSPPLPAVIAASTALADLAVLRISTTTPNYLPLAKSGTVKVGEAVFTVGFPAPLILGHDPKFTEGSVSALTGPGGEATLLQTTAAVQPGNSGGPLVNQKGEVVGIITSSAAVRAFLAVTGTLPQNVNWAVRADFAAPLFEPPSEGSAALSREEAISRAIKAVCLIGAES